MKNGIFLILILIGFSTNAFCQVTSTREPEQTLANVIPENRTNRAESAVKSMVESHRIKLGIFRLRPNISFRTGFDTNARYEHDDPIADVFAVLTPSLSAAVKLGRQSFFRIVEDVHLVYYFKLDERRDIFNTTRGEFVTGTDRMLFTVDARYVQRTETVDDEVDVPVDQKTTDGGIRLDYTLSDKIDLRPSLRIRHTELEAAEEINANIPQLRSNQTIRAGLGVDYYLRHTTKLSTDLSVGKSEDLDSERSTTFWQVLVGPTFVKPRYVFHFQVGFGQSQPEDEDQAKNRFLLDGSIDFRLSRRFNIGAFASRSFETSAFLGDGRQRVVTRGGLRSAVRLHSRVTLNSDYTIGSNDYGDDFVDGTPVRNDTFQTARILASFRIIRFVSLQGGLEYLNRDSDIPGLSKERFAYIIGAGVSYSFDFDALWGADDDEN
ncbi:outer membrane beta-barrel protein [bacterium]|nr:outer membrane beta-barrel protein [bacterium]MCI0605374.1 outer membrane beta-barrel protein [bacterium]